MKTHSVIFTHLAWMLAALVSLPLVRADNSMNDPNKTISEVENLNQQGNYREAYLAAQKTLFNASSTDSNPANAEQVTKLMNLAHSALTQLNFTEDSLDHFLSQVTTAHQNNWQVLHSAAMLLSSNNGYGSIVDGEFMRNQWEGQRANSRDRDRVMALQWFRKASELALQDPNATASLRAFALKTEAKKYIQQRHAWQLQSLTDLNQLPEVELEENPGFGHRRPYFGPVGNDPGYPVDSKGNPVFFKVPESWENAANDGERYRYLMQRAALTDADSNADIEFTLAKQFSQWFDVATLRGRDIWNRLESRIEEPGSTDLKQSLLNLSSLAENETITYFASGIKRHTLPDEFNYLGKLKELSSGNSHLSANALRLRASLLENRRQPVAAANDWQQLLERFGKEEHHKKTAQAHLQQIRGNLGKLESSDPQPAGHPANISLIFRNASKVEFKAHRIDVEKLVTHVKNELRSRADGKTEQRRVEWHWLKRTFNTLLQNDVEIKESEISQFISKEPHAQWSSDLQPAAKHGDRRIKLTTPLRDSGIYLVEASFPDGNTTRNIVELTDMVVITKPKMNQTAQFGFVLDATHGKPIANANIEAFGFRREFKNRPNKRPLLTWLIREQKLTSDASGAFELTSAENEPSLQWLLQVTARDGRKTWLGMHHLYRHASHDRQNHEMQKIFVVSDRPVYRPGQQVHLSAWARLATYQEDNHGNEFANNTFNCEVHDPRGQKIFSQQGSLNEHGAANLTFNLDQNATLGNYHVTWRVTGMAVNGNLNLSVEEYKKPEYEVLVHTPEKPVQLGEAFTATIEAKYYFGGAVTNAKVHYKIERTTHETNWFPVRPWDWLYGPGYWWRNSEYTWLPHHQRCIIYWPPWWNQPKDPPEIVAEATVPIGPDGKLQIPIDTAIAKELHGDKDHRYQITAEVVDSSRRMIVGSGSVIAPRQPFQVYVWMDRGYYETGKEANISITARDPQGKRIHGKALLKVFSLTYRENAEAPEETEVAQFELRSTADKEQMQQTLQFPKAGQYRVSVEFTDEAARNVTGMANTTVRGENFGEDSKQLRFPDLEVIAEKEQYAPGETATLNINTNNEGATVLIFERPNQGAYHKPVMVNIGEGKNTVHALPIDSNDQPNFFVEVVTVHQAKVHRKVVHIPVPPQKRIADLQLIPSQDTYRPQQQGQVQIIITDQDGKPVKGQVLITGYDKALEYISGGSNIPAIRDFFWGWKRQHHPAGLSSLNLVGHYQDQEELQWKPIGLFAQQYLNEFGPTIGSAMQSAGRGGVMENVVSRSAVDAFSAPAPAAAPMLRKSKMEADQQAAPPNDEATPMLRQEFADLLFWKANLATDENGIATVPFKTPDDLTTWKLRAWTLGPNNQVGEATVEIISRKDLLVRLQAPRFFVEKDEVVISGIVHNDLKEEQNVRAVLELDGKTLAPLEGVDLEQHASIGSGKEQRFDWRVKVLQEGEAKVRIKALAAAESDAVEKSFPVMVHGMERQDAWSLAIRPDQAEGSLTFNVPDKRRPAQTRLEIRYSPSLAAAMVDALPFLISYPHGCTEQTLNRFVPAVITQKVLKDLGLDLKAIRDKRANLNAQEIGDPKLRAAQRKHWKNQEPVFDDQELTKIVHTGMERLQSMQAADGGWGWWPGPAQSSLHLTAQIVEGLQLAQSSGVEVPGGMLEQGIQWLERYEAKELERLQLTENEKEHKPQPDHYDALAHSILVSVGRGDAEMRQRLYDARLQLSKAMQARLGLACHASNEVERRDMIIRNLEQYQKTDEENQTAWLDFGNQHYWLYWYDDEIETIAAYLRLRVARDGQDHTAPALVKYLLNHRKNGTYWRSTRDTAAALQAMAAYLQASKETEMDMLVEVWLDGKKIKESPINKNNLFSDHHSVVVSGSELTSGEHHVEIKRKGKGALYANAYLTCFTLEDHLRAAGLEVKVERKLYRLIAEDRKDLVAGDRGQALTQKGQKYHREPLVDDSTMTSGDLIEVELLVESKNDYEYLMLEDFKPAGCEAMELQSGYQWRQGLNTYREFRDAKVTHYIEHLPRGRHSITYQLRAEIPGKFHALPSIISGMYAPELKGNAEEIRVQVIDSAE